MVLIVTHVLVGQRTGWLKHDTLTPVDIHHRYCYRQAELGIGDCGGLRYIPGMTKSGKQPTPEWLQKVLGVEVPKMEGEGKTLEELLGPNPDQQ